MNFMREERELKRSLKEKNRLYTESNPVVLQRVLLHSKVCGTLCRGGLRRGGKIKRGRIAPRLQPSVVHAVHTLTRIHSLARIFSAKYTESHTYTRRTGCSETAP